MEYHIAIAPEFEISAAEFADAWNAETESREMAAAAITRAAPKGFPLDPGTLHDGMLVLTAFAGGILVDVLKDVIKDRIKKLIDKKFPAASQSDVNITLYDHHGQALVVIKKGD